MSSARPERSGPHWSQDNPIVDDRIHEALALAAPALAGAGGPFGPGWMWERLPLVMRFGSLT